MVTKQNTLVAAFHELTKHITDSMLKVETLAAHHYTLENVVREEFKAVRSDVSKIGGRLDKAEVEVSTLNENHQAGQAHLSVIAAETANLGDENNALFTAMSDPNDEWSQMKASTRETLNGIRDITKELERRLHQINDTAGETSNRVFTLSGRVSTLENAAAVPTPPTGPDEEAKDRELLPTRSEPSS